MIVDATAALLIGSYVAYRALPNSALALTILFASFASVLPDLAEAPYFFLGVRGQLIKRWIMFQKKLQVDANIMVGLLTQLIVIGVGLWWIFG